MQCFRSEKSESIPPYFVQVYVTTECNNLKREVMLYPLFHASTSSSLAFTVYSSRIYTLIKSVFINSQLHQYFAPNRTKQNQKKSWGSAPDSAPTYVYNSRTTFSFLPTALRLWAASTASSLRAVATASLTVLGMSFIN